MTFKKGFWPLTWDLLDRISEFKRYMIRLDRSDDRKILSPKINFRFGRKTAFCSYNENYWTDFRNSNGICSGLIEVMMENVVAENRLPVSTGKRFFANILRANGRIFEIQTAYDQAWSKAWYDIFDAETLLPVWTEKLKIGAKIQFLNIFPFRIERVTASLEIK